MLPRHVNSCTFEIERVSPWTEKERAGRSFVTTDDKTSVFFVFTSSVSTVSSGQGIQAALEICSRVSRNGSVICILKFIDPVI